VIDKKGMDAIFSGLGAPDSGLRSKDSGVLRPESVPRIKESEDISSDSGVSSKEYGVGSRDSVVRRIDMDALNQAIKQGSDNPRISSWNPSVMAVLRYKNLTTPAYSMSKEISELLEIAVKEKYPELYTLVTEKMEKSK
jgi:hypothetical protein